MYRQQIAKKTSLSSQNTPINRQAIPSPSYGSLSGTIQRAAASPESLREDEWLQLHKAIGTRATNEIKSGKRTSYVPEFKGISAQFAQESGQNIAPIQAKLTIGKVGDKYEQEADRIAAEVVQQISHPATVSNEQGEMVQGKASKEDKRDLQLKPMIQRSTDVSEKISPNMESAINSARGGGQPLEAGLQQSMEQAMGVDFSGVRVHTDSRSDKLNESIQAKAFTTGQDMYFRQGAYQPRSRGGQELIAHELTHVVQQNGEAAQRHPRSQHNQPNKTISRQTTLYGEREIQGKGNKTVKTKEEIQNQDVSQGKGLRIRLQRAGGKLIQRKGELKKRREDVIIKAANQSWITAYSIDRYMYHFDLLDNKLQKAVQAKFNIGSLTPDIVIIEGKKNEEIKEDKVKQIGDVFTLNPPQGKKDKAQLEKEKELYKTPEGLDVLWENSPVIDLNEANTKEIDAFVNGYKKSVREKRRHYAGENAPKIIVDVSKYKNWLKYLPDEARGTYVFDGKEFFLIGEKEHQG